MITAIADHHQASEQLSAKVLYCSDWVNAVFTAKNINEVFDKARKLLREELQLSAQDIQDLFDQIPASVEESARMMGLHIPAQADFEALLRQANLRLAQDNTEYQELTWQLEKAIAERDELAKELDNEIALAREIQRKFMPDDNAGELPITGINIPARNISGDFYDYVSLKNGDIWFVLGDVSGKGINAGMLMAKTASLFRCLAKHMSDPAKLIQLLNKELCETSTRGFFVTLVLGLYQKQTQQVRIANAGHLPVLICGGDKEQQVLAAEDPPLGILPAISYQVSPAISLQNKALYLYSDGVTESITHSGQMLGLDGLLALIREHDNKPANQRIQAIVETLLPGRQLHDDITMLMLEP
jgi:serine phosphatase RsbU (regulator of sigma subunit)